MYPDKYLKSLKVVEANREKNISVQLPCLSENEKIKLLDSFHPEFNKNGYAELKIGANRGERAPIELVRLLESNSRIDPSKINLTTPAYDVDVLIVGGGGAGAVAALAAESCGADIMIVTKLGFGDSNTIMAEGGIQAAVKDNDSPMQHFIDSYGGGRFCAKRELLAKLVLGAPEAIKWLSDLGVEFDRDSNGEILTTLGGGLSRKRMCSVKDHTGLEIMQMLRDEVLNKPIKILEYTAAVELILDNGGNAAGAVLMDMESGEYSTVRAKTVIIATGGAGRLHYQGLPTSNHYGATADGLVLAYRIGAKLIFADSMQYHPTGASYPSQIIGALVTEKARALGAKLVNSSGRVFVNSLDGRDVVSASIIRECTSHNGGVDTGAGKAVWLDTPMIDAIHGRGTTEANLPAVYRRYLSLGVDISREPILVYPTLHYQNGGIEINAEGESVNVKNLLVAGEAAGGIHGRNRLMGNSLIDIIVFGRIAGKNAALCSKNIIPDALTVKHLVKYNMERARAGVASKLISPVLLPDYAGKVAEGKKTHTR